MKLAALLKLAQDGGFLAADKKPEELQAAILAADKAAKDKAAKDAEGSGLGARNLEEKDKPNGDKGAKDKGAKDKGAKDRDDDPEGTNDEDMTEAEDAENDEAEDEDLSDGDPSTPGGNRAGGKTAIDSAEVDKRIAKAVLARDELHTALRDVEPILGNVTFDSAPKAYRAALDHLKIDTKGVHSSALRSMLKMAKDKAQASTAAPAVAMDSAGMSAMDKIIPGYSRLR